MANKCVWTEILVETLLLELLVLWDKNENEDYYMETMLDEKKLTTRWWLIILFVDKAIACQQCE